MIGSFILEIDLDRVVFPRFEGRHRLDDEVPGTLLAADGDGADGFEGYFRITRQHNQLGITGLRVINRVSLTCNNVSKQM